MATFTKPFIEAHEKVKVILETQGELAAQIYFRDAMLKLGHFERVRNLYRVKDRQSAKIKFFRLTDAQECVLQNCEKNKHTIILKSRQLGITTLSCIRSLDYAVWEQGMACGIQAHEKQFVKEIFNSKIRTIYDYFKQDWGHLYSPQEKFDNTNELFIENDGLGRKLNSTVRVGMSFRSGTLNFFHSSETAFTNEEDLKASLKCVPEGGQTVSESTPNGRGGWFYNTWQQWRLKGSTAVYKGVFLPWYQYRPEKNVWEQFYLADTDAKKVEWTVQEQELKTSHPDLTYTHLNWRRYTIEKDCNGDIDNFDAEYPTDDVSCFLAASDSFFPVTLLSQMDKKTRSPQKIGMLRVDGKRIVFDEDEKLGVYYIWEDPEPSHSYAIGADTGGGGGNDYSAAFVYDRYTNTIVAKLYGQLEPITFADQLYKLGKFYNMAHLCPEVNNQGLATIERLKELGYTKFYRRKSFDYLINREKKEIGFYTTNDQKLRITDQFKTACRLGKVRILDRDLISEMSSFVQIAGKSGKSLRREAVQGAHDDMVLAVCFTYEMHHSLPDPRDMEENYDFDQPVMKTDPATGFPVY